MKHNCISFCILLITEQKAVLSGEEQERKITTYEEAMNKIKDTTGVSDIKEVVQRFLSQGDTQKHLETLKLNNEKMLVRLKEEKVPQTQFIDRLSICDRYTDWPSSAFFKWGPTWTMTRPHHNTGSYIPEFLQEQYSKWV